MNESRVCKEQRTRKKTLPRIGVFAYEFEFELEDELKKSKEQEEAQ